MSEKCIVVPLIISQFKNGYIRTGKLRKTEQIRSTSLTGIINAGNAKPYMTIFFDQKEVVIIIITM